MSRAANSQITSTVPRAATRAAPADFEKAPNECNLNSFGAESVQRWALTLGLVRHRAPSTINRYRREVERMLRALNVADPRQIRPEGLDRYLQGESLSRMASQAPTRSQTRRS